MNEMTATKSCRGIVGVAIAAAFLGVAGCSKKQPPAAGEPVASEPADPIASLDLLKGLVYLNEESTTWYVEFGLEAGGKWSPKLIGVTPDKKQFKNRESAAAMISPGDNFFHKEPMAGRFKFLGFTEKQVLNSRTQMQETVRVAEYEDLKPNKKGEKYVSQRNLPAAHFEANAYRDRTAILEFRDGDQAAKEFKVEERTPFALPPDAKEKKFQLGQVGPEAIEVEFTGPDGTKQSLQIPKRAAP